MAKDAACKICDADLVFAGDERRGDVVVCMYCSAPFTVSKPPGEADDEWELDEDY